MYELTENNQDFQLISEIRTAVYKIGKREEEIEALTRLLEKDTEGLAYKCFFGTEEQETSWDNPKGDNLLLLAIATAGFVEFAEGNKDIATQLTNIILKDAQAKLEETELGEFINFRYGNGTPEDYNNYSIGYDNTPLTLSIKEGIPSLAIQLVELGAEVNIFCGYANFSPLHLAILHYAVKPTDPLKKNLILKLKEKGADIAALDEYGHSAKDLLQYKGLGVEDLHLFTINNQNLKEALNTNYGQKYSFKELATNKDVVKFFEDKKFTAFKANWANTNLFKQFLDENREENGNKYILYRNGIEEGRGKTEDSFAEVVMHALHLDTELQELVNSLSKVLYGEYNLKDAIGGAALTNNPLHRSFVDISNSPDSLEFIGELTELLGEVTV
ncbi:hypothetical protein [Candidatus Tisiphia endosymbiont of Hybos culiciformis]|uniref:hypothetical protein n=1 Tax=Candidatus Tisiphia endosymbiont of Hybos culiciformis TaxID=3139331 RepID=UPI003CCAE91D